MDFVAELKEQLRGYHSYDERQANETEKPERNRDLAKVPIVQITDAIVQPHAVVIKLRATSIANRTVLRTLTHSELAHLADVVKGLVVVSRVLLFIEFYLVCLAISLNDHRRVGRYHIHDDKAIVKRRYRYPYEDQEA